jgi:exopolyphosphatase/pppGpp-phosphohydrolase
MPPGMSNFLVLELGSKSLKIHRKVAEGRYEKAKISWTLGHEVYREGKISAASRDLFVDVVHRLERRGFRREAMLAIATGAVRDAGDREEFVSFIKERLRIDVRTLTGREEASLLAQGFLETSSQCPALIIDIGGGSLETVYLETSQSLLRDSLPLGAIRLHYLGLEPGGAFDHALVEEHIESVLGEASVIQAAEVNGTGGPVKAVAKVLERSTIAVEDLRGLEERILRDGPPQGLTPERSLIFFPGVMVLRRFLEHCRAGRLNYVAIPIGRIFLERFIAQSKPELRDTANVKLLGKAGITQIFRPRKPKPPSAPFIE